MSDDKPAYDPHHSNAWLLDELQLLEEVLSAATAQFESWPAWKRDEAKAESEYFEGGDWEKKP